MIDMMNIHVRIYWHPVPISHGGNQWKGQNTDLYYPQKTAKYHNGYITLNVDHC